MIIYTKKIKLKEGINSFDNEKIKKDIPEGYKPLEIDPIITLTANHVLIAYKCEKVEKPNPKSKENKPKIKSKKIVVAEV